MFYLEFTYMEFINNILQSRGRFNIPDNEYKERHHILPRCLGGDDSFENQIDLYAREHFIAHKLLAIENPNNHKLVYGWTMMAYVKNKKQSRDYEITPEEYEELRILSHEAMSGKNHPNYGKPISEEQRRKISECRKNRPSPMLNKHHTEETKIKISKHRSGITSWMAGKHLSEEHRQKISLSGKGKHNHFWYNNGEINIRITIDEIVPDGFYKGMIRNKKEES